MKGRAFSFVITGGLMAVALVAGILISRIGDMPVFQQVPTPTVIVTAAPTQIPASATTAPTATPRAAATATRTLIPPPTFEPPTQTPPPSATPSITPTATVEVIVNIDGINGLPSPTPTGPACEVRADWRLAYTARFGDTMSSIADAYGVNVFDLARGNCRPDPNILYEGEVIQVPGDSHPVTPEYICDWQVLQPFDNMTTISGAGTLTFNWRGPQTPRNLIRVVQPDGQTREWMVEMRQNETINLADLPQEGYHQWYVYPLGWDFMQVNCREGGPWSFYKEEAGDATAFPFPTNWWEPILTLIPPLPAGG
jgi:hypothetical protein